MLGILGQIIGKEIHSMSPIGKISKGPAQAPSQLENMSKTGSVQPTQEQKPIEEPKNDIKQNPIVTENEKLENKQEETIKESEQKDFDITKYYEDLQKKIWEREDTIRKETQAREDNAFQRAVADMRKSGINPNLVGINPANSGGGIVTQGNVMGNKTSAQSTEMEKMKTELNNELQKYITDANNLVKKGIATEQNLTAILNNVISTAGRLGGLMLIGG